MSLMTRVRPDRPVGSPERPADRAAGTGRTRRVAARVTTVLAAVLVLAALVAPDRLSGLTPGAFLRIPVEALLGVALVLVLPGRPRRVVAALAGVALGLLTIVKFLDMGFYAVRDRPFDLTLDWILLDDAVSFLGDSIGRNGAKAVAVGVVLLLVALLVFMTLAVLRLTRLVVRHNAVATRAVAALTAIWFVCAVPGVEIVPDVPVADATAANFLYDRAMQLRNAVQDKEDFAKESSVDKFRGTPDAQLLTGLRGKDVVLTFVESYGRDAVEDPEMASQVDAVLDAGTKRLDKAGYASRSAFLTSPTTGSGSWLAHATFLSGLWVNNDRRYSTVMSSDRMTLNTAFQRANWRTVGIMPGVTKAWPEGEFYDFDQVYDSTQLGYRGPRFSFATMPDQYTLSTFERLERAKKDRGPLMAEIPLVSSHAPWTPLPRMIGWQDVGDGSIYHTMASGPGHRPEYVLNRDPTEVRAEYRQSIEYSLESLISYVEKFGDKNLVLVFLGDHQPAPIVVGAKASRDVPITIVARDPAVLDRISTWGWQDGLNPGPKAPVWRMDSFRDRFLTAYAQ
jgi:hypothetical protein